MRREKTDLFPHIVDITQSEKILFPEDGISKGHLIAYYEKVAPVMLKHLKDRPVMMQRFPQGLGEEGFYQKDVPNYFPDWLKRVTVKKEGGSLTQVICQDQASLVYLANEDCIAIHTWLSKIDKIFNPDRMIFDLDPPKNHLDALRTATQILRETLEELELVPFLMTTGSNGLHIVVPLEPSEDYENVRHFSQFVVTMLSEKNPDLITADQAKARKNSRVFIDTLRNAYAQTGVAPYSVRAKRGAPVAKPIDWSELGNKKFSPSAYTMQNVSSWLNETNDPWEKIFESAKPLREANNILKGMLVHNR